MTDAGSIETKALAAVHEYIRLSNEHRFEEIGSLFAEDAEFLGPAGTTIQGKEAITAFYAGLDRDFVGPKLPMKPTAIALDGDQCVLAFQSKFNGKYEHCAVDQFTVGADGKVTRMIVYIRPGDCSDEFRAYHAARAAEGPDGGRARP